MVDREIVLKRLNHLEIYLNYLKNIHKCTKEEFSSDPDIYLRYERALHLAIEAVIDIGNHIIVDQRLRTPSSNSDIFKILADNKLIAPDLSNGLMKMAGFRNILVHDYLELDRKKEYEIILTNIDDIKKFIKAIIEYL